MNNVVLNYIADFRRRNKTDNSIFDAVILRDQDGKWWIKINGITTQRRLNASEIVRYLANATNEE